MEKQLTAKQIRIDFYGKDDARAYDEDEIFIMEKYASSLQPTEPATEKEPDGWVQDDNFITHAEYEELTALHEEPWKAVYFSPVSQTKGLDITDEEIGGKK